MTTYWFKRIRGRKWVQCERGSAGWLLSGGNDIRLQDGGPCVTVTKLASDLFELYGPVSAFPTGVSHSPDPFEAIVKAEEALEVATGVRAA
jgi:hypothetical protein